MAEIDDLHAAVTRVINSARAQLHAVSVSLQLIGLTEADISFAARSVTRIAYVMEKETAVLFGIPLSDPLDPPDKPWPVPPPFPDGW